VYLPTAGRFLQVDPVDGGVENNYVYPPDPVNMQDYSGQWGVVINFLNNLVTRAGPTVQKGAEKSRNITQKAWSAVKFIPNLFKTAKPIPKYTPGQYQGPQYSIDPSKVGRQMAGRGWTQHRIEEAMQNPVRQQPHIDTRWFKGGRLNDPATITLMVAT
jgi:hypothetical protein